MDIYPLCRTVHSSAIQIVYSIILISYGIMGNLFYTYSFTNIIDTTHHLPECRHFLARQYAIVNDKVIDTYIRTSPE